MRLKNKQHRYSFISSKTWAIWAFVLSVVIGGHAKVFSFSSSNDKKEDRLHLVHADNWVYDQYEIPGAQRLSGNVKFQHGGMILRCDSAVYFQASNSFEAFGHVRMTQGDTLSLTGERLYYRGDDQMAEVRQNVIMKHRGQTLYTDSLNYDRLYAFAYFFDGGKLVDGKSVLTSDWGEYHTDTRKSVFNYNVELNNPEFRIITDTLNYDIITKWVDVCGPSNIYSGDDRIYTEQGSYNTESEQAKLYKHPIIYNKTGMMEGDSVFYDRKTGEALGYNNVVYRDTVGKYNMYGDFCHYNEYSGKGLATGKAWAEYFSDGNDTLYVHADTMKVFTYNMETDSIYRVVHGYFHARAYRADIQAVADSLVFSTKSRALSLYRDPIVWSDNRQIVGEEIHAFANDSTIDSVRVMRQAMLVERLDSLHFNQVSGNLMRSYFENGKIKMNCVDGNASVVNYPLERDSAIIYQNATETAKIRMTMKDGKMQRLWAPGSKGTFYVAGLAPQEKTLLPGFAWFDYIRPIDKNDIFEWRPKKKGTELKPSVRHEAPLQRLNVK